ncbi:2'-5' RNA ligase family protein [Piscinibacter sp. XHJ-5]|uniref:2'-5' RNA ligase family protein n=1 Tax=Piscinibacter sp. XHJ-5 TaxID=3037797 RepID=UPI00245292FE|nr:2'-5' RNA ligase family protein [Piscinibacter sp. XHJ-5]
MAAEYSIWLLPRASEERALAALVASLAPRFCGMAFGPHVTVQGDLARSPEALVHDTHALAAQSAALQARVTGLEHSPHFFRCLVLRLDAGAAFDALQAHAARCNGSREGLSPYAHLSLAYGDASPQALERDVLAAIEREWLGQRLVLDRLAVVRSSKTVAIDEWRVLATHELRIDA